MTRIDAIQNACKQGAASRISPDMVNEYQSITTDFRADMARLYEQDMAKVKAEVEAEKEAEAAE